MRFVTLAFLLLAAPLRAEISKEPRVFGPGVISTGDFESHIAFTPDGATAYFLKDAPNFSYWTIMESRLVDGSWSSPRIAPFSGQYRDADPFITGDGSKFYFISDRPGPGKVKESLDIWMMERSAGGWGEPKRLDAPINSEADEWFPTVADDGTMYFGSSREGGKGRTDLYRCRWINGGKYTAAENLGDAINTKGDEFEPLIAPDQSFLIFMASGRPGGKGGGDLYISFDESGTWTAAKNLGEPINSPFMEIGAKFSPDRKTFYFSSSRGRFDGSPMSKRLTTEELLQLLRGPENGLGDIYAVDAAILALSKQ